MPIGQNDSKIKNKEKNNNKNKFILTEQKNCCMIKQIFKERSKMKKQEKSSQDWVQFEKVLENGVIQAKKTCLKVIKVFPINYDLKSNLEKEAILNSYRLFLKSCDFNFQILVQSKNENLSKHISKLKEKIKNEKQVSVNEMAKSYTQFIHNINSENKSSSKEFFIILKFDLDKIQKEFFSQKESMANNQLQEQYFKIKETLSRCGNIVQELNTKKEVEEFLLNNIFKGG